MPRTAKFKKILKYSHIALLDSELGAKVKEFMEKRTELNKLKAEIREAFKTTETGRVAMTMTGQQGYRSSDPVLPKIVFEEDGIALIFDALDVTPTSAKLHHEPSTVNMLLNGNILTKEEKRHLLVQLGCLDSEIIPHPKDFDQEDHFDDDIPF